MISRAIESIDPKGNPQIRYFDRFGDLLLSLPPNAQCLPRIRDLNEIIDPKLGNSLFSLFGKALAEFSQCIKGFLGVCSEL